MKNLAAAIAPWSRPIRKAFILLFTIILGFPLPIVALTSGTDPSWRAAINLATANGLVFGRDVIFTYGPLGFALFPVDCGTESWRWIAVVVHLVLFGFWWLSLGLVLAHIDDLEGELLFVAGSLIATNIQDGGAVITLAVLGFLAVSLRRDSLALAMLAAVLSGLSLFIKFNLGVSYIATLCAWIVLILLREPWKSGVGKGVAVLAALAATILAVHWAFGGGVADLVRLIVYSLSISADYSSQMSREGPLWPTIYLVGAVAVVVVYAASGAILRWKSWGTAALLVLPMFFEYKRAITRMDADHWVPGILESAIIPAFLMVVDAEKRERDGIRWLVALFLLVGMASAMQDRTTLAAAGLVGLILIRMIARAFGLSPGDRLGARLAPAATVAALFTMVAVVVLFLSSLALPRYPASIKVPRGCKSVLKLFHLKSWLALPPEEPPVVDVRMEPRMIAAVGQDAVDVYPWEISRALMNGLKYSPRFIFQSYQAYSPPLDEGCADHYRGEGSPKFILYTHEAQDWGHPCIVDPITWREIYRWYDIADESDKVLLLKRRETPRWQDSDRPLGESRIELGERWEVPKGHSAPILLKARLSLTATGKLVRFLYRIMPPTIRIEYENGQIDDRRLVWLNTQSGFLVSDLPRDLPAVESFFRRGVGSPVRAVTFLADSRYFERQIPIQWAEFPVGVGRPPDR